MKDLRNAVFSLLIFPVAPIAVIVLISILCREIWQESFYVPGEDGGEVEPAVALIMIPLLLIIASALLAGMTLLSRWLARRFESGIWWRWAMAVPRVVLVLISLFLLLVSSGFMMGDTLGVFRHWQVACAWLACAATVAAFVAQQVSRLLELRLVIRAPAQARRECLRARGCSTDDNCPDTAPPCRPVPRRV